MKQMIEHGDIGQPIHYWVRTRCRDGIGAQPYAKQSCFRQLPRFFLPRFGQEFETCGRMYLKTFAVVQAAYTSWENGNRVSLTDSRWTISPISRLHATTDLPV